MTEEKQDDKQEQNQKHECKEDEYKEMAQRVQAEFENFKKRSEKDLEIQSHNYKDKIVSTFLPILDSFELAIKSSEDSNHLKGMELIYSQLYDALEELGLERIKAVGEKFNPYLHEAVLEGEGDEGRVLEEFQKGYTLSGSVIRHAKVKVGKK